MPKRIRPFLALAVLVIGPAMARPAENTTPAFTLRVRSLDGLLDDAKYLATLAGKEDEAKQIDGFVRAKIGQKGLEGIDTKRPLGAYSLLARNANIGLVPIANEEAFLAFLENVNLKPTKDDDGVYAVTPENLPVPIYFRFANKYAYVTAPTKAALAKENLLDPEKVLPGTDANVMAAVWRLDQIPDALKQIGLRQMEMRFSEEQEKKEPNETEAQRNLRVQSLQTISKQLTLAVKEGRQLEVRLNIDRKAGQVVGEASLSGNPDSEFAQELAALGKSESRFGGLGGPDTAVFLLLHVALGDQVRKALYPVIDEGIRKGLAEQKNAAQRDRTRRFIDALKPTLKAGELDAVIRMSGPSADQHYTVFAGLRLQDGQELEKQIRALVDAAPASEKALIKLDVAKVGDVAIHRVDAQKSFDAKGRQLFGDNPVYVAIGPDAAWLCGGPDGLAALKSAVASRPQVAPQFQAQASFAHLALMMDRDRKQNTSQARQAAAKAFPAGEKDKVTLSVEGGKALRVRLTLDAPVIRFVTTMSNKPKPAE